MLSNLDLAYLAGVMDSDGWFTIKREEARSIPGSFTHSENVGCGQVQPAAVELLHAEFGGVIRLRGRKGHDNWQPIHYWWAGNDNAARCAALLRPYLRLKTRQADILISLRASKNLPYAEQRTVRTGRHWRMDPMILQQRHDWWSEIRSLNDRRVRPLD